MMDRNLRTIVTECIRDIETGAANVSGCLERHADRAAELRPHLSLTRFSPKSVSPVMQEEPVAVSNALATKSPMRRTLDWTPLSARLATC